MSQHFNNEYVITHGEWRPMAVARFDAMLAAMPEKIDPDLISSLQKTDN